MRFEVLALIAFVPAILAATAPQKESTIQEVIKEYQDKVEEATKTIRTKIGLSDNPNGEEIVKLFRTNNEKLAKEVQDLGKKVEEQIKSNPDATNALNNVKAKLKEVGDKFKKENPEIAQNAEKLGDSIKTTWDSIAQEIEKSYKDYTKKGGSQEQVENFFKNLIDKGKEAATSFQQEVDKIISKKSR